MPARSSEAPDCHSLAPHLARLCPGQFARFNRTQPRPVLRTAGHWASHRRTGLSSGLPSISPPALLSSLPRRLPHPSCASIRGAHGFSTPSSGGRCSPLPPFYFPKEGGRCPPHQSPCLPLPVRRSSPPSTGSSPPSAALSPAHPTSTTPTALPLSPPMQGLAQY